MDNRRTVPIVSIFPIIRYLEQKGIDGATVVSRAGLDPDILTNPDTRLTLDEMDNIYFQAILLTNDDYLGLHAGQILTPGTYYIVGYIMMNCNTVREAYEKFFRYQEVTTQGLQFQLSEGESTACIGLRLFHSTEKMIRHHAEYILSGLHTMIAQLCGRMVNVVEVRFTHPAPDDISEYQKVFCAPILFGVPELSITYDRTHLELPITAPNPSLLSVLEKHAAEVLEGIQPANTTSDRVRRMLAQGFQGNAPKIDEIAKKMAVSTRKLQLLLQEEGTSYLHIFEDVRKKLAITYLEENRFSVDEITYLLGFSEPSVFYRTFKRWTGQTPRAYRSR